MVGNNSLSSRFKVKSSRSNFILYFGLLTLLCISAWAAFFLPIQSFDKKFSSKFNHRSIISVNTSESKQLLFEKSFEVRGKKYSRRVVILTAATHQYFTNVQNLHCSVLAATGKPLILYSLDDELTSLARAEGIPVIRTLIASDGTNRHGNPYEYGSTGFRVVSNLKTIAIRDALSVGVDIIFSDVDVVWCADIPSRIMHHMEENEFGDILVQNDSPTDLYWPVEVNTGFFYAKSVEGVRDLFDEFIFLTTKGKYYGHTQQKAFRHGICGPENIRNRTFEGRESMVCIWEERVRIEMLPVGEYPNGNYPLGKSFENHAKGTIRKACAQGKIAIFHNNWVTGSKKTQRMNQEELWSIDNVTKKCKTIN